MPKEYFFVSDLHIGGDEQLKILDFEGEFIAFLKMLEQKERDTELVIIGDAFGLWELTTTEGIEKFDLLVKDHTDLFDQFRATGEHITITLIPGNHDYELACYPRFVDRLQEYNIVLEPEVSISRELAGKKIWIEHGMQHDESNRMPDFGHPHANPVGFFVTRSIVGTAGRLSGRGRYNWLRDIQSVTPLEEIPRWVISNYFYREMNPLLRYALFALVWCERCKPDRACARSLRYIRDTRILGRSSPTSFGSRRTSFGCHLYHQRCCYLHSCARIHTTFALCP